MKKESSLIIKEIENCLENSDFRQIENFMKIILAAENIIVFGAGRVGFVMKSFSMRLNHLGLNSFFLCDSNVPASGYRDLLIVGSGSGTTKSVSEIVSLAKQNNLKIICVTANPNSTIAKDSLATICLQAPTKYDLMIPRFSKQPMTTLFEQTLFITLDSIVLKLMEKLNQNHDSMSERHNVLE